MWIKSENGEPSRPPEMEKVHGGVIIRRNYIFIEPTEETPAHWRYEEMQMTDSAHALYQALAADIDYLLMITEGL